MQNRPPIANIIKEFEAYRDLLQSKIVSLMPELTDDAKLLAAANDVYDRVGKEYDEIQFNSGYSDSLHSFEKALYVVSQSCKSLDLCKGLAQYALISKLLASLNSYNSQVVKHLVLYDLIYDSFNRLILETELFHKSIMGLFKESINLSLLKFIKKNAISNISGIDILIQAIKKDQVEVVRDVLKYMPALMRNYEAGDTPVLIAAKLGRNEILHTLLMAPGGGETVNYSDMNNISPLMHAAINGHADTVLLLLSTPGIDANHMDGSDVAYGKATALVYAASKSHIATVQALLSAPGFKVKIPLDDPTSMLILKANKDIASIVEQEIEARRKFIQGATTALFLGLKGEGMNLYLVGTLANVSHIIAGYLNLSDLHSLSEVNQKVRFAGETAVNTYKKGLR